MDFCPSFPNCHNNTNNNNSVQKSPGGVLLLPDDYMSVFIRDYDCDASELFVGL